MATLIDVGFLNNFANIFIFIFVFAVIYGLLVKIDFFKVGEKNRGLNAIIAITISLLLLMSAPARTMVQFLVPWFFVLFLFIMLMLLSSMIFGIKEEDTAKMVKDPKVHIWIIILGIIILLFSLGQSFGQTLLEEREGTVPGTTTIEDGVISAGGGEGTDSSDFQQNLILTLFHPKILGLLLLGVIALIASIFMTKYEGPST